MNEKTFWKLVREQNWPKTSENTKGEAARFFTKHGEKVCIEYNNQFVTFRNNLYRVVKEYEKNSCNQIDASDDGLSDILCHIIGLGEDVYNTAINTPSSIYYRAERSDYVESFSYVVPHIKTIKSNIDPRVYVELALDIITEIKDGKFDDKDQPAVDYVLEVLIPIVWGDFNKIPKSFSFDLYRDISNKLGGYKFANLVSDLITFSPYFDKELIESVPKYLLNKEDILPDKFNREEVVRKLNDNLMDQLTGTFAAKHIRNILNNGHVPFQDRSQNELKKLIDKVLV